MLKAIETVGIRHPRGSDNYNEALEKEIKKTKFRSILKVRLLWINFTETVFVLYACNLIKTSSTNVDVTLVS